MRRNSIFGAIFFGIVTLMFVCCKSSSPDTNERYVRIARIVVDSAQLENYKAALKKHAEAAVSKESGVITLYAVQDKDKPTNVTVFEVYASVPAYQSHIKTSHFLEYKETVKNMVVSLVLTDVAAIALETKK